MFRSSILTVFSLGFLTLGCDKAADDQAKANQAQSEANNKIATASAEANAKVKAAQADADEKIAAARAGFEKLREDYRHTTRNTLVDLDKQIAVLDAKAMKAKGKAKTGLEDALTMIRTARDRFNANFNALDAASASTWDRDKANLDRESADLKALIDKA
jgi:hypothetical protein